MNENWLWQPQRIDWKHYVAAAVVALLIPLLACCIQSAWVMATSYRWYQASLDGATLNVPTFWLGLGIFGLVNFLILCLVIRVPVRRWAVAIALCAGYTLWIFSTHSFVYK